MKKIHTYDFIEEFILAFKKQLREDDKRWGDTWLKKGRNGQEDRIYTRYREYWTEYEKGTPIPWLKVIGNAFIAWIRENHPELFSDSVNGLSKIEKEIVTEEDKNIGR